jgi:hypothetical protein
MPSPMADFIKRDNDGSTLMGGEIYEQRVITVETLQVNRFGGVQAQTKKMTSE